MELPPEVEVTGVVLADHINLDWQVRRAAFICRLPDQVIKDIFATMAVLIS